MSNADRLFSALPWILILIVWAYVLVPFLAPVAYHFGYDDIGWNINEVYENFCHQRVERSIFLFGEHSPIAFYSVDELKDFGAIPEVNPDPGVYEWPEYFGHGYVGNEESGWRVPLCIRDLAMYGSFVAMATLALLLKKRGRSIPKVPVWVLVVFLVPMAVDGVAQTVIEGFKMTWVPDWYIHSISKRIVTGVMFGGALGYFIADLLSKE